MSHIAVYVFSKENGEDLEELLMPYDENMECEPYIKYTREEAIAEVRREIEQYKNTTYAEYVADPEAYKKKYDYRDSGHFEYLAKEFPKRLEWTDEECFEDMNKWYDEESIDADGNIYSTYNPKSKWDWYVVGGRWSNGLKIKDGRSVDTAYVKEIDWEALDEVPIINISTWEQDFLRKRDFLQITDTDVDVIFKEAACKKE